MLGKELQKYIRFEIVLCRFYCQSNLCYSMASSCVVDPVFLMQLIILLVFSCAIAQESHLEKEWKHWKLKYSKNYTNSANEEASKVVWVKNYNRIADHNQANKSFYIALNQFSDLVCLDIIENYH